MLHKLFRYLLDDSDCGESLSHLVYRNHEFFVETSWLHSWALFNVELAGKVLFVVLMEFLWALRSDDLRSFRNFRLVWRDIIPITNFRRQRLHPPHLDSIDGLKIQQ
jgi:hypothetical protein